VSCVTLSGAWAGEGAGDLSGEGLGAIQAQGITVEDFLGPFGCFQPAVCCCLHSPAAYDNPRWDP
jgi:hypothetical protein